MWEGWWLDGPMGMELVAGAMRCVCVCVCEVGGSGPTVMVGYGFGSSGVITKQWWWIISSNKVAMLVNGTCYGGKVVVGGFEEWIRSDAYLGGILREDMNPWFSAISHLNGEIPSSAMPNSGICFKKCGNPVWFEGWFVGYGDKRLRPQLWRILWWFVWFYFFPYFALCLC